MGTRQHLLLIKKKKKDSTPLAEISRTQWSSSCSVSEGLPRGVEASPVLLFNSCVLTPNAG